MRRAEIIYNMLDGLDQKRKDEAHLMRHGPMKKIELDPLRNQDYIDYLMSKNDGQISILQLNGYYKESLEIIEKKL